MNFCFLVVWMLCLDILKSRSDSYDIEEDEKRIIPAIFNGTLYIPSLDGYISAVKVVGGTLVWKQNLQELTGINTSYYNGIIVSKSTPTIACAYDLIIVGIYGPAVVIALDMSTGKLVWSTHLHSHPAAVLSMPGMFHNGAFYIGTSSVEEITKSEECCSFRGSVSKLDAQTGKVLWTRYMLPDNNGHPGEYAGAAIWNTMWGSNSIDCIRNHLYIATSSLYSAPLRVRQCQIMHKNQTMPSNSDKCVEPDDHSNSIIALDLDTGEIMWYQHLGGCYSSPEAPRMFLTFDNYSNRDAVVAILHDGVVLAIDRTTGRIMWWRVSSLSSGISGIMKGP